MTSFYPPGHFHPVVMCPRRRLLPLIQWGAFNWRLLLAFAANLAVWGGLACFLWSR